MTEDKKRLGEILREAGLIDELQLTSALSQQRQWGGRLASILINMGAIDEKTLASVLEKQLGEKCLSLENRKIPPEALNTVKQDIALKYRIIPIDFDQKTLTIATSDPTDLEVLDGLSFMLGVRIKPVLAIESSIDTAITQNYSDTLSKGKIYRADTKKLSSDVEIVRFEKSGVKITHPPELLISSLIEVLIDKDIITKEDLTEHILKKQKKG